MELEEHLAATARCERPKSKKSKKEQNSGSGDVLACTSDGVLHARVYLQLIKPFWL